MCRYRLTVQISANSQQVDGGGWVTAITFTKSTIIDAQDRAQAIALRDLLNQPEPARNPTGTPMWDHAYGMSNRECWQWQIAARHSSCLTQILQTAGIDWPDQGTPDIDLPVITINLATY